MMDDYINREYLYKKVKQMEEIARNRYCDTPFDSPARVRYRYQLLERENFTNMIADAPAADVVSVVRCRECKEVTKYKDELMCCVLERAVRESDFCSRGERKEES